MYVKYPWHLFAVQSGPRGAPGEKGDTGDSLAGEPGIRGLPGKTMKFTSNHPVNSCHQITFSFT